MINKIVIFNIALVSSLVLSLGMKSQSVDINDFANDATVNHQFFDSKEFQKDVSVVFTHFLEAYVRTWLQEVTLDELVLGKEYQYAETTDLEGFIEIELAALD